MAADLKLIAQGNAAIFFWRLILFGTLKEGLALLFMGQFVPK